MTLNRMYLIILLLQLNLMKAGYYFRLVLKIQHYFVCVRKIIYLFFSLRSICVQLLPILYLYLSTLTATVKYFELLRIIDSKLTKVMNHNNFQFSSFSLHLFSSPIIFIEGFSAALFTMISQHYFIFDAYGKQCLCYYWDLFKMYCSMQY